MGPVSLIVFRALSGFGMSEQAVNAAYLNEVFGARALWNRPGRLAARRHAVVGIGGADAAAARLAGSFRRCDFSAHRHPDSPLRPQGIALFPEDPAPEAAQSSGRDRRLRSARQAVEPRYRGRPAQHLCRTVHPASPFYALVLFFAQGAAAPFFAYVGESFPTRVRGSGAAFINITGPIGGIFGPLVYGALQQAGASATVAAASGGVAALLAAACMLAARSIRPGQELTAISH